MIGIVDYGMGNLGSILNMLKKIGANGRIVATPDQLHEADKLILPGVGAYDNGMKNLKTLGFQEALNEIVLGRGRPILGICLGMQLFTNNSEEGKLDGLGWFDAETIRFNFAGNEPNLKIPHMGWNTIEVLRESPLFEDKTHELRFYFAHSYHVVCNDESNILATTHHGYSFPSAIVKGNIMGTQFHPEKSHRFGLELLTYFAGE